MSQNKDQDVPKSKAQNLKPILYKFPVEEPIFWGPDQKTKYPDQYEEPKGFQDKAPLQLPSVVRFLFGKRGTVNVDRHIYLGTCNASVIRYRFASSHTAVQPIREAMWYSKIDLSNGEDLVSIYGSNLSAEELLRPHTVNVDSANGKKTDFLDNLPYGTTQFFVYLGSLFDEYRRYGEQRVSYTDPFSTPPNEVYDIVNVVFDSGSNIPAPNHVHDFSSGVANLVPLPEFQEFRVRFIQTGGPNGWAPIWQARTSKSIHIYLHNQITGGLQINTLRASLHENWDSTKPIGIPPFPYNKNISGLILEP